MMHAVGQQRSSSYAMYITIDQYLISPLGTDFAPRGVVGPQGIPTISKFNFKNYSVSV
jgi:hypothetical protein